MVLSRRATATRRESGDATTTSASSRTVKLRVSVKETAGGMPLAAGVTTHYQKRTWIGRGQEGGRHTWVEGIKVVGNKVWVGGVIVARLKKRKVGKEIVRKKAVQREVKVGGESKDGG